MHHNINETTYWVEEHGTGEPILLLHGFTGTTKTWDSIISTWSKTFRVIAMDLPGHGRTEGTKVVQMSECCQDIAKILDQLGINKIHVIGYSMGGRTALSFAVMFPQRVSSLVLESASPGLADYKERMARKKQDEKRAKKITTDGIASFVDYWENIPLFASQKKLSSTRRFKVRQERLNQSKEGLALSLRGMGTGSQPSQWEKLHVIDAPVLLVVGELDVKFVGIATKMNHAIHNSQVKVIPMTGHAIHVENPKCFGKMVIDFIRQ
ncbi:2-succinyl-6-hydroxy-2,4-cyclohexadiene-1-carboxylate synthase [Aquibacillus sp. 3ASR75-11]|uniref:Putative 2-succinyl-6-hydroxy-2,4-cyclohexadiene-1-carboxylate synthase n=1 Tax=Terrihalobacillus insolitus TaxID=2950438 RepID=A0A9X3WQB4_9BACI|nr:2-succinyl-6-hydroxy-2,4-cyclohexadiene-1-carboxylate synthase [Terrihalobacillus insolitus]MDC3412399.1 2-succinyl-6-hydroxy-2,4-cyclohexadiene-1-carboxylate synthase [Terrihalobacillus insolitus]MDC3422908.1 2-succinyl-6-hydroxy-2,4-cyclohexadiene-1-carboxylate synthase [Terrihalobacillus insolitus]